MTTNKKPRAKPSDRAEWLILDSVENGERRKYMLGSVVPKAAQYKPFDNYSPHWADQDLNTKIPVDGILVAKKEVLKRVIDRLWSSKHDFEGDDTAAKDRPIVEDAPVQLNDILAGKIAAKTTGMRSAVTNFFNMLIRKHEIEQVNIQSGTVTRYKIDNPGAKVVDTLMPCDPWKKQLQKLFDRTDDKESPLLLVTGVLLCEDIKVSWSLNQHSNVEVDTKFDGNALLALLHQPPNPRLAKYLDSKFEFDQKKSSSENVFATCKHSVILAVRYNYLKLEYEKVDEMKSTFFSHFSLFTKPENPGTIKAAKMGEVVLGRGISAYASRSGVDKEEVQGLLVEKEEEDQGVDWFYTRPSADSEKGSGEESRKTALPNSHNRV